MNVHFLRRTVCASVVAVVGLVSFGTTASAAPVDPSNLTCGVTVFTACNESAHFTNIDGTNGTGSIVGTPPPPGAALPGCPAFIATDFVVITAVGPGNGVIHSIVNNAGDGWFTSTWTGTVSLVFLESDGVTPDPTAPTYTGHLQQWFGGSFNKNNFVTHDTTNVQVTGSDGSSLGVHIVDHMSTSAVATAAPNTFTFAHC